MINYNKGETTSLCDTTIGLTTVDISIRFETKCCLLNLYQKVAYTVVVFSFKFWRENPKKVT